MLGRSRLGDTSKDILRSINGTKGVACSHMDVKRCKRSRVSPTGLN